MTSIEFILPDGEKRICAASDDMSVMEVALRNSIPGIFAECNGSAACATCHVVIEDPTVELDPPSDHENDMLDFTIAPRQAGSRLGCQVWFDHRLVGVPIRVPNGL